MCPGSACNCVCGNSLVGARREVLQHRPAQPRQGRQGPARARLALRRARAPCPCSRRASASPPHTPPTSSTSCCPPTAWPASPTRWSRRWSRRRSSSSSSGARPSTPRWTSDEIQRVQRLSAAVEALWHQHAVELARVRQATSDELHVWPDPTPNRAPTSTAQKDATYQREMLRARRRRTPAPTGASSW